MTGQPAWSASSEVAVRAIGLHKRFGEIAAVESLDLEVPRGSVFGLIGPNGAGKSTAMAMIATLLRPSGGSLEVVGCDPVRHSRDLRRRLGYMPDVLGVYDRLQVDEYLQFFAAAHGIRASRWAAAVDGLLELVGLQVKRTTMVDALSRGMKQRLALARALVHDPELLVLDEPASGLDPRARVELRDLLTRLASMGKTVIVSSHILAEMDDMCSHVAVMETGRLLASGTPAEIRHRSSVGHTMVATLADGQQKRLPVEDEAAAGELLRRLVVDEGLTVVAFEVEGRDLETIFLDLTTGQLQ